MLQAISTSRNEFKNFQVRSTFKEMEFMNNRFSAKETICNLCGKDFKARSKFERFCNTCKMESELYRTYEDYLN